MVVFTGMRGNEVDSKAGNNEIDDRSLAQLMLEQIEFANVIVLSKVQLVIGSPMKKDGLQKLELIKSLIQKLNPKAKIVVSTEDEYADLDTERWLVNTGLFNMELESTYEAWIKELEKGDHHVPETEEYGVSSFVFRASDMPFHPGRLTALFEGIGNYKSAIDMSTTLVEPTGADDDSAFKGVVRVKGSIWLANAHAFPMQFHVAGQQINLLPHETPFLAAIPKEGWGEGHKQHKEKLIAEGRWKPPFGDRQTELVFIGVHLKEELMKSKLAEALLTAEENKALGGVKGWRSLDDPFGDGELPRNFFVLPSRSPPEGERPLGPTKTNPPPPPQGAVASPYMLALKELQREYGASWNAVPAQNKQQLINERMAVRVAPHGSS
jgi:G3E family GTPase